MYEVLKETIEELIELLPFLFIAFLIIELIEHKFSNKTKKVISNNKKAGPVVGSLLGAVPQCGFSVLATNLYVTRIITLGTLIGIYLSTSDELLPILITNKVDIKDIFLFVLSKILIGIIFGFIIDLFIKPKNNDFHICEEEDCDCEDSIIKSTFIHTLKTAIYIFVVIFGINFLYNSYKGVLEEFLKESKFIAPFISSLVGLIPNCGSSITISVLYAKKLIDFGTAMAGLLTNSGIALLVLFKTNKNLKENLSILALLYFIGSIIGLLLNIFLQ